MSFPFWILGAVAAAVAASEAKPPPKILVVGEPKPEPQRVPTPPPPPSKTTLLDVPLFGVSSDADPQSRQWEVVSTLPSGYVPNGKWLAYARVEIGGKPPDHDDHLDTRVNNFPIPLEITDGVNVRSADHAVKPKKWRSRVRPDGGLDLEAAIRVGWHVARVRTTWIFTRS